MPYTLNTTEPGNRWNDSFMNKLSNTSDTLADHYLELMIEANFGNQIITADNPESVKLFAQIFRMDQSNIDQFGDVFKPLKPFFEQTSHLPPGTDVERCSRGAKVFSKTLAVTGVILLAKGLPEGYAAPRLTDVLDLSQALVRHPYRRLISTLDMLMRVCDSFDMKYKTSSGDTRGNNAIATAQKLRLWHSGVRHFAKERLPNYEWGTPVSIFDMVATIMGFSYLVIEGWEKLHVLEVTDQDKEDYYYLWKVFALLMGLHPEGEPGNTEYIPHDVADARIFYARAKEISYVKNGKGVGLAAESLRMLINLMPLWLRLTSMNRLPRVYMSILMTEEFCQELLGMPWYRRDKLVNFILRRIHLLLAPFENIRVGDGHRFSKRIFKKLIKDEFGSEPVLMIPDNIKEVLETFEKEHRAKMAARAQEATAATSKTTQPV